MNTLIEKALLSLLVSFLGDLGNAVHTFVLEFQKEAADDTALDEVIGKIVAQVADQHANLPWDQKIKVASDSALDYFRELGNYLERALVNTVIDVKVVEMRSERPAGNP